jgi:hypothetical protein
MAFKLSLSESYRWPVAVEIPIDGGRFDKQTFDAEFKRLPQDRNNQILEDARSGVITDQDVCGEILVGWSGVLDDDGKEVPFSEGAKSQIMSVPQLAAAVVMAYFQSMQGAAKRKN